MLKRIKVYYWKGLNTQNQIVSGIQREERIEVVRLQLKRQNIIVIQLTPTWRIRWLSYTTLNAAIPHFSVQLADLLSAGFTLSKALDCLSQQYPDQSPMQNMLVGVQVSLENGNTLSTAFAQYTDYFSAFYCRLIGVSEACGSLVTQLRDLSEYQARFIRLKHHLYKSLYYPCALLIISMLIMIGLIWFVVPHFTSLFESMGAKLPRLTMWFMYCANRLVHHAIWIMVIGVIVLLGGGMGYQKSLRMQNMVKLGMLQLPIVGKLLKKIMTARFAYTLAVTLKGGLPILAGLSVTREVMLHPLYQKATGKIQQAIKEGMALDQALKQVNCFHHVLIQRVSIGQRTGDIEKHLFLVANYLDQEVSMALDTVINFFEPMLLIILGGWIGLMMCALYWPLFELGNVVDLF